MQLSRMKESEVNKFKVVDEDGLVIRKFNDIKLAENFVSIRPDLKIIKPPHWEWNWKESECMF